MSDDTATLRKTTSLCPFEWCNGHDDWNSNSGDDTPWRDHSTRVKTVSDFERADHRRGTGIPEVYALVTLTEHRTTTGAVYGQPRIRLETTHADLGPDAARELAEGLTALAAILEQVDAEVAAMS
ncbi:hypothetical protein C5C03_04070 [Clavibacter michiganensis]|nr:hypothetical protein [Clavibacter michiganensis]PPF89273.1 hypothetical protein C5C03_04070 [Clavibacter michiganensis]PPF97313.1 hypothetical protein C5C05_05455 [Clavibacter michiganensis]